MNEEELKAQREWARAEYARDPPEECAWMPLHMFTEVVMPLLGPMSEETRCELEEKGKS